MHSAVENPLRIHFENWGQYVELHGIQWVDAENEDVMHLCSGADSVSFECISNSEGPSDMQK